MNGEHLKRPANGRPGRYLIFFAGYTVLALLLMRVCFTFFVDNGKSFGWAIDSLPVQLPMLTGLRDFLRGVGEALTNGTGEIPLYDFRIGMGGDILTNLAMWYLEPLSAGGGIC